MKKKYVKKIKSANRVFRKKKNILNYIIRYFFSVVAVTILVGLLFPFLSKKPSIPCANSISCQESLKFKVENGKAGVFNNQKITPPKITLLPGDTKSAVLGTATSSGEEKHIYVDLTKQTLSAYEGKKLFMQTLISSGKWGKTPRGDFKIWVKLRATRMSGGSGADFYDLPNVPFVMFFQNEEIPGGAGFSLHGTYWHNNFGHPMSHGCVNMRITDAQKLYNWVNPTTTGYTTYTNSRNEGTKITIYGDTPL